MNEQSFLEIIAKLKTWQDETVEALRRSPGDQDLLRLKLDLGTAAGCLRLCQKYGIDGRWQGFELPAVDGSFSEFRILWDYETDDRKNWEELVTDGEPVRATPGDVLICHPPSRGRGR
jgi:hypothetical protein